MRSIPSRSMRTASEGKGAGDRCAHRYAWGGALAFLLALGLGSTAWLRAQTTKAATTTLTLRVVPEERMEVQGNAVSLKIRLAPGATARLWAGTSCGAAPPPALVITRSGAYSIQPTAFGVTYSPTAGQAVGICLLSSDGLLHDSVVISGATLSAQPPGGAEASNLAAHPLPPNGLVTTTSAGVTTASSP
jgi:hypothetical protein